MERVARLAARERSELFAESAARMGTTPAVVEKDFWVSWVLCCLQAAFYPRGWARYELAVPGSLSLVPHVEVLKAVAADYRAMQAMIFGHVPAFPDIVSALTGLETEINRGK